MTRLYTEQETIAVIDDLTVPRLTGFVRARVVVPVGSDQGDLYREVDLARLRLLCDLEQDYRLDDEALALVMSLLDQLNAARADMRALLAALAAQPPETRQSLRAALSGQ